MKPTRPLLSSFAVLLLACSGPPAAAPGASAAPGESAAPSVPSSAPSASSASSAPVASASGSAVGAAPAVADDPARLPEAPTVELGVFKHDLTEAMESLALGEARAAALGAEPWIFEKGAWQKAPFPPRLRPAEGEKREGRIFFGRDDRPRIMGTRTRDGKPAQLYLRHRNEQWQEDRKEMAKFSDLPVQGMFGVLGHADPEVVCKVDDECIIKRRSGWKMMPPGPGRPRVELHSGVPWALYPTSVARLEDDKRWVTIGAPAPFRDPGGVWALGEEVWVSEPATGKLHHWQRGAWTSEPAPFAAPRGMWGRSRDDVWLAGGGGLAHYDGAKWSRVAGPTGPLSEVHGREGEVWAAGQSGVWSRRAR